MDQSVATSSPPTATIRGRRRRDAARTQRHRTSKGPDRRPGDGHTDDVIYDRGRGARHPPAYQGRALPENRLVQAPRGVQQAPIDGPGRSVAWAGVAVGREPWGRSRLWRYRGWSQGHDCDAGGRRAIQGRGDQAL